MSPNSAQKSPKISHFLTVGVHGLKGSLGRRWQSHSFYKKMSLLTLLQQQQLGKALTGAGQGKERDQAKGRITAENGHFEVKKAAEFKHFEAKMTAKLLPTRGKSTLHHLCWKMMLLDAYIQWKWTLWNWHSMEFRTEKSGYSQCLFQGKGNRIHLVYLCHLFKL